MAAVPVNKLVRNKEPNVIKAGGQKPKVKKLKEDAEYLEALRDKIVDVAREFSAQRQLDSLADLLQLIDDTAKAMGTSVAEVKKIKTAVKKEKGGFSGRKFLVEIRD